MNKMQNSVSWLLHKHGPHFLW